MKHTPLRLLAILFWLILLRGLLVAQSVPQVEHSRTMHQYIVREAADLLQREDPGMYMRIKEHLGTEDPGSVPWQVQTIMAGAWREDCEDIIYGYGGPDASMQPPIVINRPGPCFDVVYDDFREEIINSQDVKDGLVTITHFWNPNASDNYIEKNGMKVVGTGIVECLTTNRQSIMIRTPVNAWDKVQKLYRPMGEAIIDRWWTENESLFDQHNNLVCVLPHKSSSTSVLRWKYSTLPQLYNTGVCSVMLPNQNQWHTVVLTPDQRDRYVWEILGRICHLLADMSVPAHTHKDMHMGNLKISQDVKKWDVVVGSVSITVEDVDSYETWIGNPINAWWTADRIQAGLIDLTNVQDPLYHLMISMRNLAASYASDDFDGTGDDRGIPRYLSQIPQRYNLPEDQQMTILKRSMMCNIRDNTLPYAIRATATLLHWFASQLQMQETYEVRNVGAAGYDDFFVRHRFTDPFPQTGTLSGTTFTKNVGDELSLRSHLEPHPVTEAKFRFWADAPDDFTTKHQIDDYVAEGMDVVKAEYVKSHTYQSPLLANRDEFGNVLNNVFPTFRNPWRIHANATNYWEITQPDIFEDYIPQQSIISNGGIFLGVYDSNFPAKGYYSIRASYRLEGGSLAHKADALSVGDYAFIDWETIDAALYEDPRDGMNPPDPSYPFPEEYDTRIVDFASPHAIVNAHYKAHRSAAPVAAAPTRINSQRKVALDDAATHHAVYESSGRIWYTRSTDNGATWSGEELVSASGLEAARPCIAASGQTAWVTYVADGMIVLRIKAGRGWQTIYMAPVGMAQEATPVVAVLDDYESCTAGGHVICVVWEDDQVLKFTILNETRVLVDDQVLIRGHRNTLSVDQPRYPSIAASTMPFTATFFDHGFHVAWIENGSIFYCQLGVDRRSSMLRITGWMPGGTAVKEQVHARTGSVGALYPARHAPSIAVSELGTVHVAFDVVSSWSPWPNIGVAPGANSTFVLRERTRPSLFGPSWRTTATIVSTQNTGTGLCLPTIGAKVANSIKGVKSTSLRIAYNDRPGRLDVARLDGFMDIRPHEDGQDPSMTVWSGTDGGLLDLYSADASAPYDWYLHASTNHLAREGEGRLLRQRQILLTDGESRAALGISDPRLSGDMGDELSLLWDPAHDSLRIGINCTLPEKMRTAVFTPSTGAHLRMDVETFGEDAPSTQSEVLLRVHDAETHEALRTVSLPVQGFASAAAVATQDIDLSALAGTAMYFTADVHAAGENWSVAVADRYMRIDDAAADELRKDTAPLARRPVLHQNHPNPFNPSTAISFTVYDRTRVRMSVYNLLGNEVAELADGVCAAGRHECRFNAEDLPSGVYIYRLEADGHTLSRSMHLLK